MAVWNRNEGFITFEAVWISPFAINSICLLCPHTCQRCKIQRKYWHKNKQIGHLKQCHDNHILHRPIFNWVYRLKSFVTYTYKMTLRLCYDIDLVDLDKCRNHCMCTGLPFRRLSTFWMSEHSFSNAFPAVKRPPVACT